MNLTTPILRLGPQPTGHQSSNADLHASAPSTRLTSSGAWDRGVRTRRTVGRVLARGNPSSTAMAWPAAMVRTLSGSTPSKTPVGSAARSRVRRSVWKASSWSPERLGVGARIREGARPRVRHSGARGHGRRGDDGWPAAKPAAVKTSSSPLGGLVLTLWPARRLGPGSPDGARRSWRLVGEDLPASQC